MVKKRESKREENGRRENRVRERRAGCEVGGALRKQEPHTSDVVNNQIAKTFWGGAWGPSAAPTSRRNDRYYNDLIKIKCCDSLLAVTLANF